MKQKSNENLNQQISCPKIDWEPKWEEKITPKSEGKNEGWETVEKPVFTK